MKLGSTLSGITALLMVGVFYTFAFCMVEDVDENAISVEYYYSTETESAENTNDSDVMSAELADTLDEQDVSEAVPDYVLPAEAMTDEEMQVTTVVPENDSGEETVSVVVKNVESEEEEEYPEDFDVDDYSDNSAEAKEQSVLAGDNFEDKTILNQEPDETVQTEETTAEVTETAAPETEATEETVPVFTEQEPEETLKVLEDVPEVTGDIVISILGESEAETTTETSVSVSVGNGVDISTSETFTAKFNGSVQTVNAYDLICGIVYNEVSTSFSDEAIKAQAVAAYSYVKYHNVNGLTPSVLVKSNPPERIKKLVSEVWGVCCYYNGNVAQTVYMASSSGYTADAQNVWGSSVPYLKSVACPFDAGSDPNYGSVMKVSEDNMRSLLEGALGISLSGNPANWIVPTAYVDGNYVSKISIDGQTTISGRKMRETVMGYKLKSTAFDVSYSDGYFTFTTYGYGHGVGMSQNGANILAKQGYSYVDILKYYFTGIEVL